MAKGNDVLQHRQTLQEGGISNILRDLYHADHLASNCEIGHIFAAITAVANTTGQRTNDNPTGQKLTVTFTAGKLGDSGLTAHEGVHVADGVAWVASGFSAKLNPTRYRPKFARTQLSKAYITLLLRDLRFLMFGAKTFSSHPRISPTPTIAKL